MKYYIAGMFGGGTKEDFANYQWFAKLKPSKLIVTINKLLANLFVHQLSCQNLDSSIFTKYYSHQTLFPPNFPTIYGT